MSPQRRAAALLDGRHDFELIQTQVRALGLAPSGAMDAEGAGDLQGGPPHEGALRRGQDLHWRNRFAQDFSADLCIKRRRFQLLVPEQDLVTRMIERRAFLFNPSTNSFSAAARLTTSRFYPTTLTLGDGTALTLFGEDHANAAGVGVQSLEIFTPGGGGAWSALE
jgi:hypothetical protein